MNIHIINGPNLNLLGGRITAARRRPRGMSFEVTVPELGATKASIRRKRGRSAVKKA